LEFSTKLKIKTIRIPLKIKDIKINSIRQIVIVTISSFFYLIFSEIVRKICQNYFQMLYSWVGTSSVQMGFY
jgi:hypothetical protein